MRRLILSPRWILWHLLTLTAMLSCLWLSAWQWQRAGSAMGSALNVGYGLQWPLFAIFFGVMWWRFLRMELAEQRDEGPAPASASASTPASASAPAAATRPPPVRSPAHGPNPFGPRPEAARPAAIDEDSALGAYNRMLAQLAARQTED